ncbi:MAG: hypothetical protein RMI79_07060, partial [Nitrososphaerota archaeon]|nr:hypothetical protein [Nitrososphaerota archaeon]
MGRGIHSIGNHTPVVKLSKRPRTVARFEAEPEVFDTKEISDPMLILINAPQNIKIRARICAILNRLKVILAPTTGDMPTS